MTRWGGRDALEDKWDRERLRGAGNGATNRLVNAFQFVSVGNAKKRKPFG